MAVRRPFHHPAEPRSKTGCGDIYCTAQIALVAGGRRKEILTLRLNDVDRIAGEFRLRDGKPGLRMVPLTTPGLKLFDGIERIAGSSRTTGEQRAPATACRT